MNMNKDYRSFYVWLTAILGGLEIALISVPLSIPILVLLLGVAWLSGWKSNWRHYLGIGIPVLVAILSFSGYKICLGGGGGFAPLNVLCDFFLIPIWASAGIAVFYILNLGIRRWGARVAFPLLAIEIILLIGLLWLVSSTTALNQEANDKILSINPTTTIAQVQTICESMPEIDNAPSENECWDKAVATHSGIDLCVVPKGERPNSSCLDAEAYFIVDACEGKDRCQSEGCYKSAVAKYNEPAESARLAKCWKDYKKIYPGATFCQLTVLSDQCWELFSNAETE